MCKIEYTDVNKKKIMYLENYPEGIHIEKGTILDVTEKEKKRLMKMKNGVKGVWKSITKESKNDDRS